MELVLDVETTTSNNGNPFDQNNRLVSIHSYYEGKSDSWYVLDGVESIDSLVELIDKASIIIGFNFKFDFHWLRKYGLDLSGKKFWDCQLAEFLLSNQQKRYPSLDEALENYRLPLKLDIVKKEYWAKGINTDKIPWEILKEYGEWDCISTYKVYQQQKELLHGKQLQLFKLDCQDMVVIQEMEWNGLRYDNKLCEKKSKDLQEQIKNILTELSLIYPDIPINFGSTDQLSAFLYGGVIKEEKRELIGHYKSGKKLGEPRYRIHTIEHQLPRLVNPLPRSGLKKEGLFATDESTLKKLKGSQKVKEIINKLLSLSKLEKLNGTYYEGMNKINKEMNWPEGFLHGQFNQVVAATGRLSSSKPNLQNMSSECLDIFVSRYND